MELSRRQWRALEAICDTFAPGEDGLPSASEIGVPKALVEAVAQNPREAERKQTAQLLSPGTCASLTAIGGGGFERFSALPLERRERVLLSWCDTPRAAAPGRVPGAAQGRAAPLLHAARRRTAAAARSGRRSATRARWASARTPPPKALAPLAVDRDTDARVRRLRGRLGRRAAARPPPCWPPRGSTSWCSRPAATTTTPTSTAPSSTDYSRLYLNGGGLPTTDQSVAPARRRLPRRRHDRQLHDLLPDARTTCARSGPRTACPAFTSDEYTQRARRGLRAARRQPGAQRALRARADAAARPRPSSAGTSTRCRATCAAATRARTAATAATAAGSAPSSRP